MRNKKRDGEEALSKPEPEKVEAEVRGMQQELRSLQEALGELVDALITEVKPEPKEIKKLKTLKKKVLDETTIKDKVKMK